METTLLSLLPTYTAGAIPSALSSLAAALLAQSRTKASALRPDEEVARAYTCCHIACERLKQRLNLPKIEPRPPCGPRTYKKLYTYLDGALLTSHSIKLAPATLNSSPQPETPQKSQTGNRNNVPTVTHESLSTFPKLRKGTASRKRKAHTNLHASEVNLHDDENVPDWLVSSLRHLCKRLNAPTAYPHVYTGILSVSRATSHLPDTRPAKRKARDSFRVQSNDISARDWPALIIAVLLIVLANMSSSLEPSELIGPAVQILIDLKLVSSADCKQVVANVEELLEAEGPRWEEMDWFESIAGSNSYMHDELFSDEDLLNEHSTTRDRPTPSRQEIFNRSSRIRNENTEQVETLGSSLQIGLGTMMQNKIDWLSDSRQLDFTRWKARILKEIELIEQERNVRTS